MTRLEWPLGMSLARVQRRRERGDGLGVVVPDAAEERGTAEGGTRVCGNAFEEQPVLRVVANAVGAREQQVAELQVAVGKLDCDRRPVLALEHRLR